MILARKHILLLCSWYPNRVQAANGNFVEKHIRIVAKDHQVQVLQVEYDPNLAHGQQEWEAQERDDYQLLTIYFGSTYRRLGRLFTRLRLFQAAWRHLRRSGKAFELVHVHVAMPAVVIARYWKMRYDLPFVLTCHASGLLSISPQQYPWWQRQLLVRASNAAKCVMPVSQALANAWVENGLKAPVRIIPNVVNTSLFYPASAASPPLPLRLLHISNFHPQAKNVAGILRVAQRLQAEGFAFHLTIAGDGDLAPLQAYAQALQLTSEQVSLQGSLSERQVAKLMRSHSIFLLFSNYETQGVTLLEAQCCGLPVIATRVGGIPEIIDQNWKGMLVDAGDEDALFEVIRNEASQFAGKVSAQKISESAKQQYGNEAVGRQLNQVYDKC